MIKDKIPEVVKTKKHPLDVIHDHLIGVIQGDHQRKEFVAAIAELTRTKIDVKGEQDDEQPD